MKKRILQFMALLLTVSSIGAIPVIASANENTQKETYSEGYTEQVPYGVYLQMGTSSINKTGTGKIYAKGVTIGEMKISDGVRVERLIGNAWVQQDYFSASKTNTYTVTASKTLTVPIGYFYRVKSFHTAHTDSSSSRTEGLYI